MRSLLDRRPWRRRGPAPLSAAQARALELVRPNTMLDVSRLRSLWEQVVVCDREMVPGALVECGVWKGGAVAWMALAGQSTGAPPRHVHLFDAFDDICEPDPELDGERALQKVIEYGGTAEPRGRLEPMKGIYNARGGHGTIAECRDLLAHRVGHPEELTSYHVGWFQHTIPEADTGPIAVLRLDGDWYASTKVCLDHLYDHVVSGGYVVIDDYLAFDGCRLAVDEFRSARDITSVLTPIDVNAVWWRVDQVRR